jgi:protease I
MKDHARCRPVANHDRESGMDQKLRGKKIAVLATHGFEESELLEPKRALEQAGAEVVVVSPEAENIKGWKDKQWGGEVKVDCKLADAKADDYAGLVLPGGVMNPDRLRMNQHAVAFVKAFFRQGKPIAAICHGPWLLVEADVVKGLKVTSWPSLQTDIRNAGGNWVDEPCVVDRGVVTSRKPDDLSAFNQKAIEEFAEGVTAAHRSRAA